MKTKSGTTMIHRHIPQGAPWPALRKLADELAQKLKERSAARQKLDDLHRRRQRGSSPDRRATARALRQGKELPEPEDVAGQIEAARVLVTAYDDTLEAISADLETLVEGHRETWLSELQGHIETARSDVAEAVAVARRAYEDALRPALGLAHWLEAFPRGKPHALPPAAVVPIAGEDVPARLVLAALESTFSTPAAELIEDVGGGPDAAA